MKGYCLTGDRFLRDKFKPSVNIQIPKLTKSSKGCGMTDNLKVTRICGNFNCKHSKKGIECPEKDCKCKPNHSPHSSNSSGTSTLSDKRKGFVKIPEGKLNEKLKEGYYYGTDVKEFIKELKEEIDKIKIRDTREVKAMINYIDVEEIKEVIEKLAGKDLI